MTTPIRDYVALKAARETAAKNTRATIQRIEGKDMTDICKVCGLPIAVCNAIACYREAIKNFRMGEIETAHEYTRSAEDFYRQATQSTRLTHD